MELSCLDVINSNRFGGYLAKPGKDMLDNDDWLRSLLNKWGLNADFPMTSHYLNILRELRSNMQQAVKYLNVDSALCTENLANISLILEKTPCRMKLVADDGTFVVKEEPLCDGWSHVIWSVAYSFAKLMSEHDPTRIKICDNEDCGWIFYDESKSRTRRWCDHSLCGNIMKVRRYRSRKKQMD